MILAAMFIPIILGVIVYLVPRKLNRGHELLALAGTVVTFILAVRLFALGTANVSYNWFTMGNTTVAFDFRLYPFSRFIMAAASAFAMLITLYSWKPIAGHSRINEYYAYLLICLGATNGAVLSNNFLLLLVFWETLLILTYLFITLGKQGAYKTATKSLILGGVADFLMILGVGVLWMRTGTLTMTDPSLPVVTTGYAGAAFILMMIGASAKAGSMPFHTWIPDAAIDAPLPFMAFLPAALEKLLGIYLLARIGLDFFRLDRTMSIVTMTLGAVTILLPVFAALVQKDYKKLLSFHAISQVGYMVMGIGTNVALGVAGGVWHMLNHSMYKSTLFLTGGSVEKQTGTTDLRQLGGLGKKMPLTALCAFIAAASISGIPPLNGYFSKELVYHGAHETGLWIFVIAAMLGSTMTLVSFLKLTFTTYLGQKKQALEETREAHWTMLVPMLIIAAGCVLFGVYNQLPIRLFIQPLISAPGVPFSSVEVAQHSWLVTPITLLALAFLALGFVAFFVGRARTHESLTAMDYVHDAPVLRTLYGWSEKRYFDIYEQGVRFLRWLAGLVFRFIERLADYLVEGTAWLGVALGQQVRKLHTGLLAVYLSWVIFGIVILLLLVGGVFK
ncbi:MAG TPA: proton-conducting transporter membrane subunit [bacterium]|nr:proton-conducting transporter membrane subunit [bacterium]